MFVTYIGNVSNLMEHRGNTVSILNCITPTEYRVGRYNSKGVWCQWIANISELDGFDGV